MREWRPARSTFSNSNIPNFPPQSGNTSPKSDETFRGLRYEEMIILSDDDRNRFEIWLEQQAHSLDDTAEQMKKLKGLDVLVKKFKAEAAAHHIVASKLRTTESDTVSN